MNTAQLSYWFGLKQATSFAGGGVKPLAVPNTVTGANTTAAPASGQQAGAARPIQTGAAPLTPENATAAEKATGVSSGEMQNQKEMEDLRMQNQKLQMDQMKAQHELEIAKADASREPQQGMDYSSVVGDYMSHAGRTAKRHATEALKRVRKVQSAGGMLPTKMHLKTAAALYGCSTKEAFDTPQAPKITSATPPKITTPQAPKPAPLITTAPQAPGVAPLPKSQIETMRMRDQEAQQKVNNMNRVLGTDQPQRWYSPFRALGGMALESAKGLFGGDTTALGDTTSLFTEDANKLDAVNAQPVAPIKRDAVTGAKTGPVEYDPQYRAAQMEMADQVDGQYSQHGTRTIYDNIMSELPDSPASGTLADYSASKDKAIADRSAQMSVNEPWKIKNIMGNIANAKDTVMGGGANLLNQGLGVPEKLLRSGLRSFATTADDLGRINSDYRQGGLSNVNLADVGAVPMDALDTAMKMYPVGSIKSLAGKSNPLWKTLNGLGLTATGMNALNEPGQVRQERGMYDDAWKNMEQYRANYGKAQPAAPGGAGWGGQLMQYLQELLSGYAPQGQAQNTASTMPMSQISPAV